MLTQTALIQISVCVQTNCVTHTMHCVHTNCLNTNCLLCSNKLRYTQTAFCVFKNCGTQTAYSAYPNSLKTNCVLCPNKQRVRQTAHCVLTKCVRQTAYSTGTNCLHKLSIVFKQTALHINCAVCSHKHKMPFTKTEYCVHTKSLNKNYIL